MFSRKAIIRAIFCAALAMIPFPDQENQVYDQKVRLVSHILKEKPSSVLLLELSKEDFETLKRKISSAQGNTGPWREKYELLRNQFFWDEKVYELLLERILAEHPLKILVTFFYNENLVYLGSNPAMAGLVRNPHVLWASQFDIDGRLIRPAPELTGTENYGFNSLQTDSDGVVRKANLIYRNHISLPFRALIQGLGSLSSDTPLIQPFLIRYAGKAGFIPSCRAIDLFNEGFQNPCGRLSDRYVILTSSANTLGGVSLYQTPLGTMGQGEILANILLTALNHSAFRSLPSYITFLLLVLHGLVIGLIVLHWSRKNQLLLTIALLLGEAFLIVAAMIVLSLHIPFIPFLSATLSSYFAFLWMKFHQQESKRWQAEKKAQYLRELDELKSNFMSLMSHDLKTPIAKVQALSERLKREAQSLSEEQKDILASIQRSNEELAEYIVNILNFQRIESKELKPQKKSHDINLMIEDVIERIQPLIQDRNIHLNKNLEPMFPIDLDEQLIKQVLTNLIDNAVKYNKEGTTITISSQDLGDSVQVTVEDNGCGIEKEQMKYLFKKFARANNDISERVKGTGLGLYLAKYFIELHGGTIEVKSEPEKGTQFQFRIPMQQS